MAKKNSTQTEQYLETVDLALGQRSLKTVVGTQPKVLGLSAAGRQMLADNVVAMRKGANLHLLYPDGHEVVLDGFFNAGMNAKESLPTHQEDAVEAGEGGGFIQELNSDGGDVGKVWSVGSDQETVITPNLSYAHGWADKLLAMAQSEPELPNALSSQMYASEAGWVIGESLQELFQSIGPEVAFGGMVMLVAATGSDSGTSNKSTLAIEGLIAAGPVIAGNDLVVTAFRADGTQLGQTAVNADGSYQLTVQTDYTGIVVVQVKNTGLTTDYWDEGYDQPLSLTSDLRAVSTVNGAGTYVINVNPITEIATRKMGLAGGANGVSVVTVTDSTLVPESVNSLVAQALGLDGTNLVSGAVVTTVTATGANNVANANNYGKMLAAVSALATYNGQSTEQSLAQLASAINDAGQVTQVTKNVLVVAASQAPDATGLGEGVAQILKVGASLSAPDTVTAAALDLVKTAPSNVKNAAVYSAAGVAAVDASNFQSINNALTNLPRKETAGQVQEVVDAYNAVLSTTLGGSSTATPTLAQYTTLGVSMGTNHPGVVSLLGSGIQTQAPSAVDTVAELQSLANAAAAVQSGAAGAAPPTFAQLQMLGIEGVTLNNLNAVLAAISATADDGNEVDTLGKLQALTTTTAATAETALSTINSGGNTSPTDYTAAGVTGVDAGNVAAVNNAINGLTGGGASTVSTAQVQAAVDAYNAILALADGSAGISTSPTAAQYAAVGVTGADTSPGGLALLGNAVDVQPKTGVDTVAKLQTLTNAANAVMSNAGGGTGVTQEQLQALGITGVTTANLATVQAAIAATPDNGSAVDTLSELQAMVNAAAITVDTTAPTASATTLALSADTAANGTSNTDFNTKTASQILSGTLSAALGAGETVYVSVDNGSTWTAAGVNGTSWSLPGVTLSGSSTIQVKVTDMAGNDSASILSQAYVLDTTAPLVSVGTPGFQAIATPQTISATLSATLATGETLYGSLDNGTSWTDLNASVTGTALSWAGVTLTGSNTLKLKVSDAAGNDGPLTNQTYVVNVTNVPTTTINAVALSADTAANGAGNADLVTKATAQTISATLSAALVTGEKLYGSLDNGASWIDLSAFVTGTTLSWTGVTLVADNTFKFKVTDANGNNGQVTSQPYVLDTTAPTASATTLALSADTAANGTSNTDFNTKTASQILSGTLSAALGAGETVYVSVDNGSTWTAAGVNGTSWSLPGVTLSGSSTIQVKVTDMAGNDSASILSQAYVLDTTAPTTQNSALSFSADQGVNTSDRVTRTASQTVSGTLAANLAAGETIYISTDGGTTWRAASTSAVGTTAWTLTGVSLIDGTQTNTIRVKVTDAAGNDNTNVQSYSYTLDTVAPAAASLGTSSQFYNSADATAGAKTLLPNVALGTDVDISQITVALGGAGLDVAKDKLVFGGQTLALNADANDGGTSATVNTVGGVNWRYDSASKTLFLSKATGAWTAAETLKVEQGLGFQTTADATQGQRTFAVTLQDQAGNTQTAAAVTQIVTVDTGTPAPTLAIESGQDAWLNNAEAELDILVSYTGLAVGDKIQLRAGGANVGSAYTVTDTDFVLGQATVKLYKTQLGADGNKPISARVTDLAGNAGTSADLTVKLDTLAPADVDLVSATPGVQTTQAQSYMAVDAGTGKVLFANVAQPGEIDIGQIKVHVSGALDQTNDQLLFGSQSLRLTDSGTATGTDTVGGVTGVDWSYTGATNTLTFSKNGGGAFTGAQVQALEAALQFKTSADAIQGNRSFTLSYTDLAGNTGLSASDTVTVSTTGLTPVLTAQTGEDSTLNANESTVHIQVNYNGLAVNDTIQLKLGGNNLGSLYTVLQSDVDQGFVLFTVLKSGLNGGVNGSYSITAAATNSQNNTATSAALVVTVDNDVPAPALAIKSGQDAWLNIAETSVDIEVGYTGLAVGDKIQLQVDGANVGNVHTVTDADVLAGKVTLSLAKGTLGLDGDKAITAIATDLAGNASTSADLIVKLDTAAPGAVDLDSVAVDTQATATTGYLVADAGTAKTVFANVAQPTAIDIAKLIVNAAGAAADPVNDYLKFGNQNLRLSSNGTGSGTEVISYASTSVSVDWSYVGTSKTLSFALTGGGAFTAAQVQGIETALQFKTSASASQGVRTFELAHQDLAGNTGTSAMQTVSVVTIAPEPTLVIKSGQNEYINASEATVDLEVSYSGLAEGDLVELRRDGTLIGLNYVHTVTPGDVTATKVTFAMAKASLVAGTQGITAMVTNSAGNSGESAALSLTLDTGVPAPTLAIKSGQNEYINASEAALDFEVSYTGMVVGDKIWLQLGGTPVGSAYTLTNTDVALGKATVTLAKNTLGLDGDKVITATATDVAGNVGTSADVTVKLDTAPPSGTVLALGTGVANGATLAEASAANGAVTIKAENGSTIEVTFTDANNHSIVKTITGAGLTTAVSVVLEAADIGSGSRQLGNGLINVNAKVSDAAGNSVTETTSFTLDTVAPTASSLSTPTQFYNSTDLLAGYKTLTPSVNEGPDADVNRVVVELGGAGLDVALDQLQLGTQDVLLNIDAAGSGLTINSVTGVTWAYTASSRTLVLTHATGAWTAAQLDSLQEGLSFKTTADTNQNVTQDERTFNISYTDQAGNTSASSSERIVVDTLAPAVIVGVKAGANTTLGAGETTTIVLNLSEKTKLADIDTNQITVVGGTLDSFSGVAGTGNASTGFTQFTATFTANSTANIARTVSLGNGVVQDSAHNFNTDQKDEDNSVSLSTITNLTSIALTSNPGIDKIYAKGDVVQITATFNSLVLVDTDSGIPSINIQMGNNIRSATYFSGSATKSLVFRYVVGSAGTDLDLDGLAVPAGSITLNNASIKNLYGSSASVDYLELSTNADHMVDGSVPLPIDLGTGVQFYNFSNAGSASAKALLPGVQEVTDTDLVKISITLGGSLDAVNDKILVGGYTLSLDVNVTQTNLTVGGVTGVDLDYNATTKTLVLNKAAGLASAEALAIEQALQFKSTITTTEGDRTFAVAHVDTTGNTGIATTQTVRADYTAPGDLDLAATTGTQNAAQIYYIKAEADASTPKQLFGDVQLSTDTDVGSITVTISTTDAANDQIKFGQSEEFLLDTTPRSKTLQTVGGLSDVNWSYSDSKVLTFSKNDGTAFTALQAQAIEKDLRFFSTNATTSNTRTFVLNHVDLAGNIGAGSATTSLTVDLVPPSAIDINTNQAGVNTADTIYFGTSDKTAGAGVTLLPKLVATTDTDIFTISVTADSAGLNGSTDALKFGEGAATNTQNLGTSVNSGTTAVTVGGSSVSFNWSYNSSKELSFTKTDGSNFTAAQAKALEDNLRFVGSGSLAEGDRNFTLKHQDKAGNASAGVTQKVKVDLTAPTFTIDLDSTTGGNQVSHPHYYNRAVASLGSQLFPLISTANVGIASDTGVGFVRVTLAGAMLDAANDKFMVGSATAFALGSNQSISKIAVPNTTAFMDVSYDASTKAVTVGKWDGGTFTQSELQEVVKALYLVSNDNSSTGEKTFKLEYLDMAKNASASSGSETIQYIGALDFATDPGDVGAYNTAGLYITGGVAGIYSTPFNEKRYLYFKDSEMATGQRLTTLNASFDLYASAGADGKGSDGGYIGFGKDHSGFWTGPNTGLSIFWNLYVPYTTSVSVRWNGQQIGAAAPFGGWTQSPTVTVDSNGVVNVWHGTTLMLTRTIPNSEWKTAVMDNWTVQFGGGKGSSYGYLNFDNLNITSTSSSSGSPLVLDLNGDGVQTLDVAHGVQFDINADHQLAKVGWVSKQDAFLALDLDGNGQIDSGAELFGNSTRLADGNKAQNGWQALAQHDANHDGQINALDAIFAQLRVWQDANSDGVSQSDELRTLLQAGVRSIDLNADDSDAAAIAQNGNILRGISNYTAEDGTQHQMVDAWLQIENPATQGMSNTESSNLLAQATAEQKIDLASDTAANVRDIRLADVLGTANLLVIQAGGNDTVRIETGWSNTGQQTTSDLHTYTLWSNAGARLLIEQTANVQMVL